VNEFTGTTRFEIVRRLGAGGMGVVYLVHDHERSAEVALKTIPSLTPSSLYRFKQEFRALAGLSHPNLAALYELFVDEDQHWFFTMEYVDGSDFLEAVEPAHNSSDRTSPTRLRDTPARAEDLPTAAIDENVPTSWNHAPAPSERSCDFDRLRAVLRQVAGGLLSLHAAGMLHRDIKPSNVMVGRDGRVVILDFGLVLEMDGADELATDLLAGTVAFMSPEQAAGRQLTNATDWYSLGVMVYRALTGVLPHPGRYSGEVLLAKQSVDPIAPRELHPEVPADLNDLCLRLLERDPARRLTGAELLVRLGATAPAPATPAVQTSTFVGRKAELRQLEEAWQDLRSGKTTVVEVSGKSGVGKSRLVRHFLSDLERRERPVILSGRCYEQESVPFKAMDSLIDGLSRYLRRLPAAQVEALLPREARRLTQLFPVLDRVEALSAAPGRAQGALDPMELRRRAFQALRELLGRIGDRQPLILSIDDLQWGDADSALLLTEVLRPPDAPALLLLVSYRAEYTERSTGLQTLFQELEKLEVTRRALPVGTLPEEDTRQLAQRLLGEARVSEEMIGTIVKESGGNAYFVRELAASSARGGDVPTGVEHLDALVWKRVCGLASEARDLLEAIAVAGQPLQQRDAFQATGSRAWNVGALALLRAERLIRSSGSGGRDEVEAYHDRIREAILAHLEPERLRHVHLQLARAQETHRSADPETLAVHFDAGGDVLSAGRYYQDAGEAAVKALAFRHAAGLLARALQKLQPGPAERGELLEKLGEARANAGLNAEAARNYLDAAACPGREHRIDLMRKAAYQYCSAGYVDEGTAAFAGVLSRVALKLPGSPVVALVKRLSVDVWLLLRGVDFRLREASQLPFALLERLDTARLAGTALSAVDIVGSSYFTGLSLALSLRAGEPERLLRSLAWEAVVQASFNERGRRRATRYLEKAGGLVGSTAQPAGLAFYRMTQGIVAFSSARFVEAQPLLAEAESIFSGCTGVQWELAMVRTYQAWNRVQRGAYREMAAVVPAQYTDARERGDLFMAVNLGQFPYLITLLVQNRADAASALLDECEALWRPKGYQLQVALGGMGRCWLEIYRGNGPAAWEVIERHWNLLRKNMYHLLENLAIYLGEARGRAALLMAEQCVADGKDAAPYLKQARADARRLQSKKLAHGPVMGTVVQAGVEALEGNRAGAIALLERAVRDYESLGQGMLANTAKRRLGQLTGDAKGAGLVGDAEQWLRQEGVVDLEAITRFHACGLSAVR